MAPIDLGRLFESRVSASSGFVTENDVANLAPLSEHAAPTGFNNWAKKRQREFRCGRHHAGRALEAAGASATLVMRADDGVPLFPPGYHGSITHTGRSETFAAAVVAESPLRVGIDAENLRTLADDMIAYILSPEERETLKKLRIPSDGSSLRHEGDRALVAFSAKEAFYKCTYPDHRTFLGFHDVEFSLHPKMQCLADGQSIVGSYELRLLKTDISSAPRVLRGRFLQSRERVLCGIEWSGIPA